MLLFLKNLYEWGCLVDIKTLSIESPYVYYCLVMFICLSEMKLNSIFMRTDSKKEQYIIFIFIFMHHDQNITKSNEFLMKILKSHLNVLEENI